MVNVGIRSRPGINSSIKLKTPPIKPFLNPNIRQKISADMGAQITSPRKGISMDALPIKSMSKHFAKEGNGRVSRGK